MRWIGSRCVLLIGIVALVCATLGAGSAAANAPIYRYTNTLSNSQAGGHPDVITEFEVGSRFTQASAPPCECNDPKTISIHTPAGLIANPHVVSMCSAAELASFSCASDSQVGFALIKVVGNLIVLPLYRTVPQSGQAALFVFNLPLGAAIPEYIALSSRTGGDYGLDFKIEGVSHGAPPEFTATDFWGVPGAKAHDPLRFAPGEKAVLCETPPLAAMSNNVFPEDCVVESNDQEVTATKPPIASSLPIAPFTESPTTCIGPLTSTLDVLAYDGEETHASAPWPATTGCDKLSFNPSLSAKPTTTETDSASGLAVDVTVPQFEDPSTPSPSELRANTVTLPPGFSINAGAADGKTSCSDEQANFTNEEAAQCPEFSKVGTTVLESSALPGPIPGFIYLADPKPGDPYRIFLTASGFGTNVKIAGSVKPDPTTGQLVTSFPNLPQSPFQRFDLHFFGSERGLLATPTQCGTYPVTTTFKPWASELSDQTVTQFFTLESGPNGQPCPNGPRPFAPSFQAGSQDNTGGAHSPFTLQLTRQDGDQNLSALSVKTPPGFSATLAGIPYCPESAISALGAPGYPGLTEQASPLCPQASKIGTVIAGAGAGTHPIYVKGAAYLAGPYKGAPLSLLAVIPAISGPYDLGNVVVRSALQIDPQSAQVTAVSDPLPQILEGIPLRTRFIRVSLDRAGFALNPTNCEPFQVQASVLGSEGAASNPSTPFQVANCADLPYEPKLRLKLTGGLGRRGHPAIHARFTQTPGQANNELVSVALPKGEQLDNEHLDGVCTRVQFAANACPAVSVLGSAEATTPLLDQPLKGNVYLLTHPGQSLPDVVAALKGQIEINLTGRIDTTKAGALRTSFEGVPDAPVSSFALDLLGGAKGLIQNESSLCATPKAAAVRMVGQNGKATSSKAKLEVRCSKAARKKARRQRRAAR